MNLPIELLRTFVTVVDLGNLTRTGETLGRSQPAISLQIKRLETLLGVRLLQRSRNRVLTTQPGRQWYTRARQLLALNDQIVHSMIKPKVSGNVHLGIPNEFATVILPDLLRRFAQAHPEIAIRVTCDLSVNLVTRLADHEFDLVVALSTDVDAPPENRLWVEPMEWVAGCERDPSPTGDLSLIVAPEGCIYRRQMFHTLKRQAIPYRLAYTSPNFSGIKAGVIADLGITALARSAIGEGMRILAANERLPRLGQIEASLQYNTPRLSSAAQLLSEHILSLSRHTIGASG